MQALKITSKRQVTLPSQVCDDLGVEAGEKLFLERREIDGRSSWVIETEHLSPGNWFGRLRKYSVGKSHDMKSIRSSIGERSGRGRS